MYLKRPIQIHIDVQTSKRDGNNTNQKTKTVSIQSLIDQLSWEHRNAYKATLYIVVTT